MKTVEEGSAIKVFDDDVCVFSGELKDGKLIAQDFSVELPKKWTPEEAAYFLKALEENLRPEVAAELETYFAYRFLEGSNMLYEKEEKKEEQEAKGVEEQEEPQQEEAPPLLTLHDVLSFLSGLVKNDDVAMISVFLTCLSAYTDEPVNLFLKGESSIGKTYIARTVSSVFPDEDVWKLAGISPKALIHLKGHWEDEDGNIIDIYHPPDKKKDPEAFREWKEKVDNARYVIELKNKILIFLEAPTEEVYKVLRPLLSHDEKETEFKIVEKDRKGPFKTQTIVLRGWPATIFCTTNVKYIEELATRSFTVSPSTAGNKIKDAVDLTLKKASQPSFERRIEVGVRRIKDYMSFVKEKSGIFSKVLIPYADIISLQFFYERPREMRDVSHLLSFIKATTIFNFVRRPVIETKDARYLVSTVDDLKFVLRIFEHIRETTELGLPEKVVRFYHEVVESLEQFDAADATAKWNALHKLDKKSNRRIRAWLSELEDADLVSSQQDPQDRRRTLYTVVRRNSLKIPAISGKTEFSSLFTLNSFENWLKNIAEIDAGYKVLSNWLTRNPIDSSTLYRTITKSAYTQPLHFRNNFSANSLGVKPKGAQNSGYSINGRIFFGIR
jgi:hypothetical protein